MTNRQPIHQMGLAYGAGATSATHVHAIGIAVEQVDRPAGSVSVRPRPSIMTTLLRSLISPV